MTDDAPQLRTGLRDRLPRGLSHPVGAELVSRALAGVPDLGDLWLAFGGKVLPFDAHAPRELRAFTRLVALVCNYRAAGRYLAVEAVPSAARAVARRVLVEQGLPRVAAWLRQPRPSTWYEGFRVLVVGAEFAEPTRVALLELDGDRVVACDVLVAP